MISDADQNFMRSAIAIAKRGLGRTSPNPTVGCVIVGRSGHIIARARTSDGGRPHAETNALQIAGENAKGATVYVTLEPCSHYGQTSPCAEALIAAGVSRVVIGTLDCDPRVSGKGVEILENAEIQVQTGVLQDACNDIHRGFFTKIQKNRPYITLKAACTVDGKIATARGESQWITEDTSRENAHLLRSQHDAILVGVETVLADDCTLTVRELLQNKPMTRIVLDSGLRLSLENKIMNKSESDPVWIFYDTSVSKISDVEKFKGKSGVILIPINPRNLEAVLGEIAKREILTLMVEGGASVHSSFLKEGLYDAIHVYRAPKALGAGAKDIFSDLNIKHLIEARELKMVQHLTLGKDSLEIYKPKE